MPTRIQPLAYWSRWKAPAMATFTVALAVVPNLPDFGRGLTYTSFLFTPIGTPIRIVSSFALGSIGLVLTLLAITSIFRPLAVWIEDDELVCGGITTRKLPLTSIKSVMQTAAGVIRIERTDGGSPFEISAALIRSRADVESVMRAVRGSAEPQKGSPAPP